MTKAQRLDMLRDVIQNMAERNSAEEIAAFLNAQIGGDDIEIAKAYAHTNKPYNARSQFNPKVHVSE